ncbi:biopolymer transporter Tol [Subtercola boreus]|uniref:Biopolymer transporter Tol n=1 Tax=Subtercola boreus TaxID=120213 RepID=A0A3E0W9Q2_9MICO|nr:biopolymer transporter Tol [Subtercola boreus]RFA18247.1 biopolymer transporter Tol [Subtercola boreus]RFA18639.1 biopolymer transporter Tol [Subtercola boreus]RFA25243.1 biopolymer transporter Tol [Subtercola boreus]
MTRGEKHDGEEQGFDADRWLLIDGRRWRRTEPSLPDDIVAALKSHLGRGRSGVRTARRAGDEAGTAAARRRNGLAKLGLGERGPYWWEVPEKERLAQARQALRDLDDMDMSEDT